MRSLFSKGILAALFVATLAPIAQVQAQGQQDRTLIAHRLNFLPLSDGLVYDNTNNYTGSVYRPGGAVAGAAPITRLVADDITFIPGYGGKKLTQFYFSLYNANPTPVAARPRVRFWFPDGTPAGAPGTYYNGATPANTNIGYTFTFAPPVVSPPSDNRIPVGISLWFTNIGPDANGNQPVVPTGGKMWISTTFDNNSNGVGYATPAELNNLGVALFNPANAGSSSDGLFQTTNPGSFFGVSNPAGAAFDFGHSADPTQPVASMFWGWAISGFSLFGQVNLEGVADSNNHVVTFDFKVGGVSQFTVPITLTTLGAYEVQVPPGNYTVSVKGDKWLKSQPQAANLSGSDVLGVNYTLKAGDVNNDNVVDISDLLLLIGAYNQVSPATGYMAAADFNEDGTNDITDLLLLIGNYNQLGGS